MILSAPALRHVAAVTVGVMSLFSCGAAIHEGATPASDGAVVAAESELAARDAGVEQDASADGAPTCPHGALEDSHRGFVRCLEPGEADGGVVAPPLDGGVSAAPDAAAPGPPPRVEVGTPSYENGDVPNVPKMLKGVSEDIAQCIADHGGMQSPSGSLKVQFLVRARGRAEGVEVLSSKGVTEEAAGCVRLLLKNKAIGSPSADPVGVTVTFSLKETRK